PAAELGGLGGARRDHRKRENHNQQSNDSSHFIPPWKDWFNPMSMMAHSMPAGQARGQGLYAYWGEPEACSRPGTHPFHVLLGRFITRRRRRKSLHHLRRFLHEIRHALADALEHRG